MQNHNESMYAVSYKPNKFVVDYSVKTCSAATCDFKGCF
jgi:hypothetical protein